MRYGEEGRGIQANHLGESGMEKQQGIRFCL